MKLSLLVLLALVAAGCGAAKHAAAPLAPRLPRALAQSWARQADAIAASIDAGNGCTAQSQATALRVQIVQAINAHKVARGYLEPLTATVNELPSRISCTPPPVVTVPSHGKSHGKSHGNGQGNGNGNGDGGD